VAQLGQTAFRRSYELRELDYTGRAGTEKQGKELESKSKERKKKKKLVLSFARSVKE
jgi:hypothetical protein